MASRIAAEDREPSSHSNNFGFLRLLFAFLVLVSHSFEIVDGDRSREPLTRLFGTISLGDLGVDGFFLISGYLIVQSYERSSSIASYLWKRILRIYPAFIVTSVLCLLVVAPLAGADMSSLIGKSLINSALRLMFLSEPRLPGVFADQHYASLDGSMWTIKYEFRCYLLVIVLGLVGIFKRPVVFLTLLLVLSAGLFFAPAHLEVPAPIESLFGAPIDTLRLTLLFLVGVWYSIASALPYRAGGAIVAASLLLVSLLSHATAHLAVAFFGGYLLFWFAFLRTTPRLNHINNATDISYGVYLYAWPVQNLLVRYIPNVSPWTIMVFSTVISMLLAWLSWKFVERPCLQLKRFGRPSA